LNGTKQKEETIMAVTDSKDLQRLRREESSVTQMGRQALQISVILRDFPQYAAAREKADVLLAKAASIREQITKIRLYEKAHEKGPGPLIIMRPALWCSRSRFSVYRLSRRNRYEL